MLSAPFRVVLDACVLYPLHLRDVLLQAAAEGLYEVHWSKAILDEATRNLTAKLQVTEPQAAHLVVTMTEAFPEAAVTDYEHLVSAMRNDPKDRHVIAAAVKAGAQVVVTDNTRDFSMMPDGIEAQTADDFLCNLFDLSPDRMMLAAREDLRASNAASERDQAARCGNAMHGVCEADRSVPGGCSMSG